ncbi:MAG: hypothetical protein M1828_003471 [Chrysothrix sp. TS-e1954]|nr:MAG: hypothetical protein M1828_003471 [Chrysothrix sp. TS-e1954]
MIPPSLRLRRAIALRSLSLVRRIILANPQHPELVRNPDLSDRGRTSLHQAAELGLEDIAEFLVDQGHEDDGFSRDERGQTPLMLAADAGGNEEAPVAKGKLAVAKMLVHRFPDATGIRDKDGMDTFQHAAKHGTNALLVLLLSQPPPSQLDSAAHYGPHPFLSTADASGNTPLHYASAFGHLKTLGLLISAGANDKARNALLWMPIDYSASVAVEVYQKNLIKEREQVLTRRSGDKGAAGRARGVSDEKARTRGIVRLVGSEGSGEEAGEGNFRPGLKRRERSRTGPEMPFI